MIKGYIKRQVNAVVHDLTVSVSNLEADVDGTNGGSRSGYGRSAYEAGFYGYSLSFGFPGLKERVKSLEQKVDLLLEHLNLCKTDVPAKTVLKKCKDAR